MNKTVLLGLILLILAAAQQQSCLLQDPVTDSCIQSLNPSSLDKEVMPYLCIITDQRGLLDKAEQFCREASIEDLDSGYRYFRQLIKRGKFQEAFRTEYNLFFVSPFTHNEQLKRILEEQKLSISSESSQPQSPFGKAILLFYSNQTQMSLIQLRNHLQNNKENKQLIYEHFLMARILQKQYQYYDGMNYITSILKTNSKFHPYLFHLKGNFLMHHVQFEKAIKQFQRANAEFQNFYKVNGFSFSNYNIGLCYEKLGKVDDAIKYYEKSIINLNSAQALNALGHAYFSQFQTSKDRKKLELAQNYYKAALKVNEQYTVVIFNLGMLRLVQNRTQAAIEYFQKCIHMEQTFRSCQHGLIKSYYQAKQPQKAKDIIDSLQKNEEVLTELLAILYQEGDHKMALQLVAQGQDFKSSLLMEWKGFNEYASRLFERAQKSFSRAIFLGGKKAYLYYSLGLAQLELKQYEACAKSFKTANDMQKRAQTKQKMEECQQLSNSDL